MELAGDQGWACWHHEGRWAMAAASIPLLSHLLVLFLNGLEELEAFSSTQKVLWWLETHVPNDSGSLAKEDEDWGNKVDKEHAQEMLEEDSTGPVSSERREDRSQKQESRDTAKEDSGQEMFQRQENEKPAARGEGISKLQSTSPALAASMDTKDKAGTSPGKLLSIGSPIVNGFPDLVNLECKLWTPSLVQITCPDLQTKAPPPAEATSVTFLKKLS
ncbi:hypothetical protein DUI87_35155 [Hirundo rustica rustica]|uniref:Uncharacterized protein n=1 Tax=Hirundo rustica rustica TaxID=333673 RepID=A0A3M0IK84_HIRRU|nr:hypothetical protein DUI87_35155 [Hirundo rustica rustica]